MVSSAPSTDPDVQQFATLDEDVEAAGSATDPLVLIDPGEHALGGPFTTALELRARTLGTAPLAPVNWANCGGPFASSPAPAVVLQPSGKDPALRVALTNPEARVTLAGVGLQGASGTLAAVVTSEELLVWQSRLSGRVLVQGASARGSLASVGVGLLVAGAPTDCRLPPTIASSR